MEIVREVLADLQASPVLALGRDHAIHMLTHDREPLFPCRFIVSWQKTPGITEGSSGDHKACQISFFPYPIFIVFAVAITQYRYSDVFLELIDGSPVRGAGVFLLVGSSVDSDEFRSGLFETLSELDQIFHTVPAQPRLHAHGDIQILSEDVHDAHRSIPVDHQA